MMTIPIKFVIDNAKKYNLLYWQISDAGNEIGRQDDDITIDESLNLLEDSFNDLKDNARAGDKVKISMQSEPMTNKGRKKGLIMRSYSVYLKEPDARAVQGIGNIGLIEENVRLKLAMQHDKEKQELLKRIEALEAPDPTETQLDRTIDGINSLLNHPITSLVVSYFAGKGTPQAPSPAINGLPKTDYSDLLERIEKIDPSFVDMLNAIVTSAENDAASYFMYRKMLVK